MKNQGVSVDVCVAVVIPLKKSGSTRGQGTYSWHLANEKNYFVDNMRFLSWHDCLGKRQNILYLILSFQFCLNGELGGSVHAFYSQPLLCWPSLLDFFSHRAQGSLLIIKCHETLGNLGYFSPGPARAGASGCSSPQALQQCRQMLLSIKTIFTVSNLMPWRHQIFLFLWKVKIKGNKIFDLAREEHKCGIIRNFSFWQALISTANMS